jgi:hypothetical protein
MPEDSLNPEDCLRSLAAEALRCAPHRPLFPESVGLMAVANAFVMLGLLPEPRAEAVLADHKSALERMGLGSTWGVTEGELTVRPGAHEYWQARSAGTGGLREVPLLAAAAGVCCPTSVAETHVTIQGHPRKRTQPLNLSILCRVSGESVRFQCASQGLSTAQ